MSVPHRYSHSLRRVAPHLAKHDAGLEMLRALASCERELDAQREDPEGWATAEAVHYVSTLWHGGQTCPLYAAGCATEFEPGPMWRKPEDWAGRMAAAALVRILRDTVK